MPGNSAIDIPPIVNDFVKENQATALYNLLSHEGEGYKKLQSIAEKISTELKTNLTDNSRKSRLSISNNSKGLIEIGMCLNFISQFAKADDSNSLLGSIAFSINLILSALMSNPITEIFFANSNALSRSCKGPA